MRTMKLNDRARSKIAADLAPGERVAATVLLANRIGTGSAHGDGTHRQGGSALATPYACRLGLDLTNPALRADLMNTWLTVTDHRLLFHRPKAMSIRPTPGALVDAIDRHGVLLHWFDAAGLGLSNRVVHLRFPDGRHLLSATMLKATLRRRPFDDEPFLLVDAFADAAVAVDHD